MTDDPPPLLALMVAVLTGHTATPGGLCVGQAPAFDRDTLDGEDEATHAERLARAWWACKRCPERSVCPAPVLRVPRGC